MTAYYNEIDPSAAEWLRQLISLGEIAPGEVDERDIRDVTPDELAAYTQCHFFAGIGVWSYALRSAGWSDDRPVWTGSCPCQPFSTAGKRKGSDDDRDLWWAMFWLISQCRPETVFGEQVASKDGLGWWDTVQSDLERANYAATAFDLCAAGVGAPHIRQRLFWVAYSGSQRRQQIAGSPSSDEATHGRTGRHGRKSDADHQSASDGENSCSLADSECAERGAQFSDDEHNGSNAGRHEAASGAGACSKVGRVGGLAVSHCNSGHKDRARQAKATGISSQHRASAFWARESGGAGDGTAGTVGNSTDSRLPESRQTGVASMGEESGTGVELQCERPSSISRNFWNDAIWLPCADGKTRPAKPGAFPLVDGIAPDLVRGGDTGLSPHQAIQTENTAEARAMRLKGYGNAIVGPLAACFVSAYMQGN